MNWNRNCAAVIPCRNEARAIGAVVRAVRRHLAAVLVVDDGSADDSADRAARAGARVLRREPPPGKGAALRLGWRHARGLGFEWVVTLDGDGQHRPDDIPALLQCAIETGADLVVGNRMAGASQMPPLRRFVNRWMSRRLSNVADRPLPDSQCGFRLMNLDALEALPIRTGHFEIESEVLLAFAAGGCRIGFVPIQVIYGNERSKIRPLRDAVRWFRWFCSARQNRPTPATTAGLAQRLSW